MKSSVGESSAQKLYLPRSIQIFHFHFPFIGVQFSLDTPKFYARDFKTSGSVFHSRFEECTRRCDQKPLVCFRLFAR